MARKRLPHFNNLEDVTMKTITGIKLAASGFALLLQACASTNVATIEDRAIQPTPYTTGSFGSSVAADMSGDASNLGTRSIAITQFGVRYRLDGQIQSPNSYFDGKADSKSVDRFVSVTGLNDSDLSAITAQAYARFVKALKQKGYRVLGPSELNQSRKYNSLEAAKADRDDGELSTYSADSKAFGSVMGTMQQLKIAKELSSDAITVNYDVHFATYGGTNHNWEVGQVALVYGKLHGEAPDGKVADMSFGQPAVSEKLIGKFAETTTAGSKAVDVALNLAFGGKSRKAYTLWTDAPRASAAVLDAIDSANARFVARIGGGN